jgi:hypothetical protein
MSASGSAKRIGKMCSRSPRDQLKLAETRQESLVTSPADLPARDPASMSLRVDSAACLAPLCGELAQVAAKAQFSHLADLLLQAQMEAYRCCYNR